MKTIYAEVWVHLRDNENFEGREWKQFFCSSKEEVVEKVAKWLDKAEKIEVIPS